MRDRQDIGDQQWLFLMSLAFKCNIAFFTRLRKSARLRQGFGGLEGRAVSPLTAGYLEVLLWPSREAAKGLVALPVSESFDRMIGLMAQWGDVCGTFD